MKFAIPAIAVALLIAAGCQEQQGSKPTTDAGTLDVNSAPTPVAYAAPAPAPTDMGVPSGAGAANGSYTIKRGDTLWKIASQHYGDGKKWREIADANPGLTPSELRVGQTITLP